tara:strand:+ start:411 stop:521 length:111 start_codon:yes stop_codon:yes gene_type:complete
MTKQEYYMMEIIIRELPKIREALEKIADQNTNNKNN